MGWWATVGGLGSSIVTKTRQAPEISVTSPLFNLKDPVAA